MQSLSVCIPRKDMLLSLKRYSYLALLPLSLAGLSLAAAHPAAAQTNLVANPSFESPIVAGGTYSNNSITSWTGTNNTAANQYGVQSKTVISKTTHQPLYTNNSIPDGNQYAYVNNMGSIYQNIAGTTLVPGQTYTLSAYLGIRSDQPNPTGDIDLETVGGTILAGGSGLTSAPGTFTKYTYTFTDPVNGAYNGQGLRVSLGIDGTVSNRQVDFDEVTLTDTSPAPEPAEVATLSLVALGLGGLLLQARKRKAAEMTA